MTYDDGLRVDHAGLEAAAQDLATAVRAIESRLGDLEADLRPLVADWSGHAREAYRDAQSRWHGAVMEMRDLLERSAATVRASNDEYRAADLRGARAFEVG